MYSPQVMDHFTNPRNVGEIPEADGIGLEMNQAHGDVTRITLRVQNGRIAEARFQTTGCGAAIACGSMVTELAKGKELGEAAGITRELICEALGGLPSDKMECSTLAIGALHRAIEDCRNRK